jgi:EmrB/QacA subfamily drug resistance transporter
VPEDGPGARRAEDRSADTLRGRRLLLAALLACTFLTALDVLVVGTAMPTIVSQLGGMSLYTWVFSSYLLSSTVTVPVYGKLADTYGRKPVFAFGTIVFLLGSALCGVAQDMTQLVAFRIIQGLGAGAVFPVTLTIVGDVFSLEERARIVGFFSATWGIAGIVGPVVGGFITDYLNWRLIFLVNLPVGAVALAMLWSTFRERVRRREHQIDYLGAATLTIGLTALMLALLEAGETLPGLSATAIALFGASAALLAFFGWHERRAAEPIIPPALLTRRLILVAGLCVFLNGVMNAGTGTFVPVFAQGVLGGTATLAGAVLIPTSFTWTAGSIIGGRVLLRIGYRSTVLLGALMIALGALQFATVGETSPIWVVLAAVGVIGLGMGFSMSSLTIAVQNAVPWNQRGVVTSTNQFFRSIGQAIGVAALGAVFNLSMGTGLAGTGHDLGIANAVLDPIARGALDPTLVASVRTILDGSIQAVFVILVATAVVNVLVATQLPGGSAKEHAWQPHPRPGGPGATPSDARTGA